MTWTTWPAPSWWSRAPRDGTAPGSGRLRPVPATGIVAGEFVRRLDAWCNTSASVAAVNGSAPLRDVLVPPP
jgi:hypothetical protein